MKVIIFIWIVLLGGITSTDIYIDAKEASINFSHNNDNNELHSSNFIAKLGANGSCVADFITTAASGGSCHQNPVIVVINGDCNGTLSCDGELIHIPCCSDFGTDVGWCDRFEDMEPLPEFNEL